MAERRMFAKTIVLSDAFLDMPLSARCLYFTLGMLADDDGFVNSPKSIMRQCGAAQDDLRVLFEKKFLIPFESGVVVIKHWRINNYLQKDRYNPTKYIEEKETLELDSIGNYHQKSEIEPMYTQDVDTQDRLGKVSIGKVINNNRRFVPPSIQEVSEFCSMRGNGIDAEKFIDYYQQQGWRLSNGNPMKDWKAAIRNWEHRNPKKTNHELDGVF